MITIVEYTEEERQITLLALAELALSRPGFDNMLKEWRLSCAIKKVPLTKNSNVTTPTEFMPTVIR